MQTQSATPTLQNAATTNVNGTAVDTSQFGNKILLEVQETAGGTATLTPEGSFDGTQWYALGFQPIGAQATLTRTVTAISVTANLKQTYQILDQYPQTRARLSGVTAATVTVKLFGVSS